MGLLKLATAGCRKLSTIVHVEFADFAKLRPKQRYQHYIMIGMTARPIDIVDVGTQCLGKPQMALFKFHQVRDLLASRRFFALLVCFAFVPWVICQERKLYSLVKIFQTTHRRSCQSLCWKSFDEQRRQRCSLTVDCTWFFYMPRVWARVLYQTSWKRSVILALWFYNCWNIVKT